MANNRVTPSPSLLAKKVWRFFSKIPKGNIIFSRLAGYMIPYTGSIKPVVLSLEEGHATVRLRDRRAVRNHLKSIHAIALANLGEFTTGLSLISLLDNKSNAILTKIEVVYLKKARGTLVSESNIVIPSLTPGDTEFCVTANIKNEAGELVCQVLATWRVRVAQN